ncbi:MAG: hypothetical protein JWL84_5278 [Rhodospirillales bacterium]|jgi:hypothetical protein|nr:hypothetical protein [Rhodospirillales bacterium]
MPTEIRHLLFTPEEVTTALRNYCNRGGRPFPSHVKGYVIEGGPAQPSVTITATASDGRDTSLSFGGEKLVAPLLLFCNGKKIPLPLRGTKELTILNQLLTLVVKLA